jgi:triphosphoribosyl-dephospho-CoA synthase
MVTQGQDRPRQAFLAACAWDVAVRKPGNVSQASAGHRMQAQMFLDSAEACVGALTDARLCVGERIEAAVRATRDRVGCNTNLGIVLLCAPLARAFERASGAGRVSLPALREAWLQTMDELTVADAAAAFRAIALAHPAGLGEAPCEDVRQAPSVDLRAAMALAADRDCIAAQYRDGAAHLFDLGLAALAGCPSAVHEALRVSPGLGFNPAAEAAVQSVFLAFLAGIPDSHIVRKHGSALAHSVLQAAVPWRDRAQRGDYLPVDPAFDAWDEALKADNINPGTSADLTVATLMAAALLG